MAAYSCSRITATAIAAEITLKLDQRDRRSSTRRHHDQQRLQIRAANEGFRSDDAGSGRRWSRNENIDDANNLRVLRERMEVMKAKERLERLFVVHHHRQHQHDQLSWTNNNNNAVLGSRSCYKREKKGKQIIILMKYLIMNRSRCDEILEVLMVVCGTFGFTVATGTLCLCLASILVHFN